MDKQLETFADELLGFSLPMRNARARVVRLDKTIADVLVAHDYPPPVTHLLGEALVLSALMGGLLKADGDVFFRRIRLQIISQGFDSICIL